MSHDVFQVLLQGTGGGGGGGGGGCGTVLATPYDDNFDCPSFDTTGGRFTGANAWTLFNPNGGHAVNSSVTQTGGECLVNSGNTTSDPDPHGATQPLPVGDWRFRAKMRSTVSQSYWSLGGLILYETATAKNLLCFMGYDLSYMARVWAQTGLNHAHSNTYGGTGYAADTADYWLEVARVGSTLTYRVTDVASDGNNLAAALTTSAIMSVSQTTDFTTAPDKIGLFSTGNVYILAFDWFKRLA